MQKIQTKRRKSLNSHPKKKKNNTTSAARLRKYWSSVHRHKKQAKCILQATAKYKSRPSPPYPANMCCGKILNGNDGNTYISKPNAFGICIWSKI